MLLFFTQTDPHKLFHSCTRNLPGPPDPPVHCRLFSSVKAKDGDPAAFLPICGLYVLNLFKLVQAISECKAAASQGRGPSQSGVTWCHSTCTDTSLQRDSSLQKDWRPRIKNPAGITTKSRLAFLFHFGNQPLAASAQHVRRERSIAKAEQEGKGAVGTSSSYPRLLETSLQSSYKGSYLLLIDDIVIVGHCVRILLGNPRLPLVWFQIAFPAAL